MKAEEKTLPILYIQKAKTPIEVYRWHETLGPDMETIFLPGLHSRILPGDVEDTEREEVEFTELELEEEILKCIERAAAKCQEDNLKVMKLSEKFRGEGFHTVILKYVRVDSIL